jgi:acyl-CoA hydrolase
MIPFTSFSRRRESSVILALLLALILSGCTDTPDYTPLPPGSTVLAFGDSVTHGTGANAGEDYPTQLAELTGWRVVNAGVPGDTARNARNRLGALLASHRPSLVIIELGGNDFLRKRAENRVAEDLREMIESSQASGAQPVLVAVPRLSLLRAGTGTLRDSAIYAELAGETGIVLVEDTFSDVLSSVALRADPIHPNAEGYRVLAQGIAERLRDVGLLSR